MKKHKLKTNTNNNTPNSQNVVCEQFNYYYFLNYYHFYYQQNKIQNVVCIHSKYASTGKTKTMHLKNTQQKCQWEGQKQRQSRHYLPKKKHTRKKKIQNAGTFSSINKHGYKYIFLYNYNIQYSKHKIKTAYYIVVSISLRKLHHVKKSVLTFAKTKNSNCINKIRYTMRWLVCSQIHFIFYLQYNNKLYVLKLHRKIQILSVNQNNAQKKNCKHFDYQNHYKLNYFLLQSVKILPNLKIKAMIFKR
eukprot:TRINITY_DN2030_c0_g4_i1.p1 TRINITY_DN2030_c0_g4~~TRINITY_DN2030_c0_g4_i1.p1  ORF type:complete len:247 (+),score=-16.50 TRINITY_DN2030_c0_g4_i1:3586-4326(+)